jgi:hypothetical protein
LEFVMGWSGALRRAGVALGAISLLAGAALTQGRLSALAQLEPGLWQLRDLDDARAAPQSICVADPSILMQVQHRNAPCSRLVIASDPKGATVHYTCPLSGFGRTSLRVETPRLARIDTQGIVDNAPFALRAEARRVGNCGATAANAVH